MKDFDFGFAVRPTLRVSEVERILRRTRVITPTPSRQNLINLVHEGKLLGFRTSYGYVIYEDSFRAFVRSLQNEEMSGQERESRKEEMREG